MTTTVKRRALLGAALTGGVALGLGARSVSAAVAQAVNHGNRPQPADSDTVEVLLRHAGELGGRKHQDAWRKL